MADPTFVTTDLARWGAGTGLLHTAAGADVVIWDLSERIRDLEDNPVVGPYPVSISASGLTFSMGLSNGATLGPITFEIGIPRWRGDWAADVSYQALNFFRAPDGHIGIVLIPHVSEEPFDWGAEDGSSAELLYRSLSDEALTELGMIADVVLTDPVEGDALIFDGTNWVNAPIQETLSIDALTDVVISPTSLSAGQVLTWDGAEWVNEDPVVPSGSANTPLFDDGDGGFTNGTRSGDTTKVVTTTGSLTTGHIATWDANGNAIDGGPVPSGGSGGVGDVTAGSTSVDGELASYNGTGGKTLKQSFAKLSGPTSTVKTFTLPNADATLLYDGSALGTPSSGTATNLTGLPISTGVSGLASGIATFLATPSSANLRAALTDEVGTGAAYFVGGALGTPASGDASNLTNVPASSLLPINTQTASYTLVIGDAGKLVEMDVASANNLTVPPNSSVAFVIGTVISLRQIGAGQTTIVAGAGVTIRTPETLKVRIQYGQGMLHKRGTDEWCLEGNLEPTA